MTLLRFAPLLILLLGIVAHAEVNLVVDDSSDFGKCFCWDTTTDTWCAEDGKTRWWRDSCSRYFWKTAAWTIPAAALFCFLLFFPFVFFLARMLCNCCGGRKPSYGCCCPVTATEVMSDVGAPIPEDAASRLQKPYSNRSIFLTKFLTIVAFATYIYYTVGVYQTNEWVHTSTENMLTHVQYLNNRLLADLDNSVTSLASLSQAPSAIVPPGAQSTIASRQATYQDRHHSIDSQINGISDAENKSYGRRHLTGTLISCPTAIFLLITLLMVCNVRGGLISFLAGLMSLCAAAITLLFIVSMIIAQATVTVCDNYNTTFVPFLVNVIQSNDGCASTAVISALNATGQKYGAAVCSAGLMALCQSAYNCPANFCGNAMFSGANYQVNLAALTADFTQSTQQQGSTLCPSSSDCSSIAKCAENCNAGSTAKTQATAVLNLYAYNSDIAILEGTVDDTMGCDLITSQLYGPLEHTLCGSFDRNYTSLTIVIMACCIIATIGMFLFILGAKRYTKMTLESSQPLTVHNFVYGVLVTSPEEREIVGSPLHSNNQNSIAAPPVGYPERNVSQNSNNLNQGLLNDGDARVYGSVNSGKGA